MFFNISVLDFIEKQHNLTVSTRVWLTDERTEGRTDTPSHRDARTHLKLAKELYRQGNETNDKMFQVGSEEEENDDDPKKKKKNGDVGAQGWKKI